MSKKYYVLGAQAESFNDGSLGLSLGKKDIGVVNPNHPFFRNLATPVKGKHIIEISKDAAIALIEEKGYTEIESPMPQSAPTEAEGIEDEKSLEDEKKAAASAASGNEGHGDKDDDNSGNGAGQGNQDDNQDDDDDKDGAGNDDDDDDEEDELTTKSDFIEWIKNNESIPDDKKKDLTKLSLEKLKAIHSEYTTK